MKRKFSIALSLAVILTAALNSLALAADPPAQVTFTADIDAISCPVLVLLISYTDPNGQPISQGTTPFTISTAPGTPVEYVYSTPVPCPDGTTYDLDYVDPKVMPSSTTTTVTGVYDDTTAPAWTTWPGDISVLATSPAGAVVTYNALATDPSGVSSQSCFPVSGGTFPIGTTAVGCTATDTPGNTSTGSFNVTVVTVVDTTLPVITVPADITVEATGPAGAVVSFTASAIDAVDGPITPICLPASGSTFPLGTTPVTCTATDTHGNSASASFNVTVVDTTRPDLTVPADIVAEATSPVGAVVGFSASASDIVDGAITPTCAPASGSTFPMGTTAVTCVATDAHGNSASASFNVTVRDTMPPALTLPSNMKVTAWNASGAPVGFKASAYDLVDGPVAIMCSPVSDLWFPIGMTTVNCWAADSRGNTARSSFTVAVQYATSDVKCNGVPGHQILQPINTDGSSIFKQGSTVPVRFRVCGLDGISITTPGVVTSFRLTNADPEILSTTPDEAFHSGGQWKFNIDTKNLTAGNTYDYLITLNDGSTIQFQFTLK